MAEARAQPAVEVEAGADAAAATFTLHHEDHTMGNTLRYVLNKNPAVSFVGYSVPHPAEPKLQLRLQTVGPPAAAVLQDALGTVHDIGQHVLGVFDEAVAAHKAKPPASR